MYSTQDHIDRMNYLNDPRTQGLAQSEFILYLWDEATDTETEVKLPTHFEVCPTCQGHGKHTNPSIDAGGISTTVFAEDPDFADDYFSGALDVTCSHCEGKRVVEAVNEAAMTPEHVKAWHEQLDAEAQSRAEHLAELRMGA